MTFPWHGADCKRLSIVNLLSNKAIYNYWGPRYYINLKKLWSCCLSRYTFRNSYFLSNNILSRHTKHKALPLLLQSYKKDFSAISCSICSVLDTLIVTGENREKNHLKNVNIVKQNCSDDQKLSKTKLSIFRNVQMS